MLRLLQVRYLFRICIWMKPDTIVGATDLNSPNGPILPWLRSVDGLNTHDDAYELAMAGGVTSAQVLPGSSNVIGRGICDVTATQHSKILAF